MPDLQATTTTVSRAKKLDGARELRELILSTANTLMRHASWRNLWWKPWHDSGSSAPWSLPAPGGRMGLADLDAGRRGALHR